MDPKEVKLGVSTIVELNREIEELKRAVFGKPEAVVKRGRRKKGRKKGSKDDGG